MSTRKVVAMERAVAADRGNDVAVQSRGVGHVDDLLVGTSGRNFATNSRTGRPIAKEKKGTEQQTRLDKHIFQVEKGTAVGSMGCRRWIWIGGMIWARA